MRAFKQAFSSKYQKTRIYKPTTQKQIYNTDT